MRTSAGRYVFQGLTAAWRLDSRVSEVLAAVPKDFRTDWLPAGVTPLPLRDSGWIDHVRSVLPALADGAQADVIFSPNGFPPRDRRAVIYFQDLYHFKLMSSTELSLRDQVGNIVRAFWRSIAAQACMLAVPVSSDIEREVVRRMQIPVKLIPNGVDVGALRWSEGDDVVLVLGGGGARKGEVTAIRAWAQMRREHGPAGTRLEIAGVSPPERRVSLESLAEASGVGKSVTVIGPIPREHYLERIAAARVAVCCSTLEAFGLPVAEALALGAPVLATDLPSHVELMARAGAGETFPVNDHIALAGRLQRSLMGDTPSRLTEPPDGWTWSDRAREHIDAYSRYA